MPRAISLLKEENKMRIYNPTYKKIAIDWDNVTLPVNEGTPFSASGTIANTSDAIGLLPVYIWKKPIDEEVYILIGGDVYQSEVEEAFGAELTDDAIASMGGINFYESDGTIDKSSGGGGGGSDSVIVATATEDQDGNFVLNKTWQELRTAQQAGKIVISPFASTDSEFETCFLENTVEATEGAPVYSAVFIISPVGSLPQTIIYECDNANDYPMI